MLHLSPLTDLTSSHKLPRMPSKPIKTHQQIHSSNPEYPATPLARETEDSLGRKVGKKEGESLPIDTPILRE